VYGELFSKDCFGFTCKSMSIVYKISDAPTLKRKIVSVSSIQYPPDEVQMSNDDRVPACYKRNQGVVKPMKINGTSLRIHTFPFSVASCNNDVLRIPMVSGL